MAIERIVLRWPTEKSKLWLSSFIEQVQRDANVVAVVAVGSTIRSNVRSEDLDLVVLCEDLDQFHYKAPIEVDLRAFALPEVHQNLSKGHPLLGWAAKFGEALFERDGVWAKLMATWRASVPLPDPKLAREQADKVLKQYDVVREMGDDAAASELQLSHLTLIARAVLSERGVYPASRPELVGQLRSIGESTLASELEDAIERRAAGVSGSRREH
jgi:predicted nucleotidyltransferase